MAHRIEIKLEHFETDDHHKARNFLEDVWRLAAEAGWTEWEDFDHRIAPGAVFTFSFPARQSHQATAMVERAIRGHMMGRYVTTKCMKGESKADG